MRRKFRWDDENPTCAKCGVSLTLRDGCEWGDDKSLILCNECAIGEVERLRARVKRLKAKSKLE